MPHHTLQFSVIVPAKNEQDNLAPLIAEISTALTLYPHHEIIYVDDGSDDNTLHCLQELKKTYSRLRVLHHAEGLGQSLAVLNGVRHATGEWVIILDGDGQNDPADIPLMLDALFTQRTQHPQLMGLIGHRVNRQDDWVKRLSSRCANAIRKTLLNDGTPDTGCGLKVVLRQAYLNLPSFDHMHRYIPALIQGQGGMMTSFPVNHRPRQAGQSKYGVWNRLWVGLVDVLGVWWLLRRSKAMPLTEYSN